MVGSVRASLRSCETLGGSVIALALQGTNHKYLKHNNEDYSCQGNGGYLILCDLILDRVGSESGPKATNEDSITSNIFFCACVNTSAESHEGTSGKQSTAMWLWVHHSSCKAAARQQEGLV